MYVELLQSTPIPKKLLAEIASICYDSVPREKIVDHCFESGHESILEHVVFTFGIEGVSRALTHQLVRHRIMSPTQRSQRYVKEDRFGYVTPDSIWRNDELRRKYQRLMTDIQGIYNEAISQGVPAEDARYVLPNATSSKIVCTFNLRSLINFMRLRLCMTAQWEIRQLAEAMAFEIEESYPELAKFLAPECIHLGYCRQKNTCGIRPTKKAVLSAYEKNREA